MRSVIEGLRCSDFGEIESKHRTIWPSKIQGVMQEIGQTVYVPLEWDDSSRKLFFYSSGLNIRGGRTSSLRQQHLPAAIRHFTMINRASPSPCLYVKLESKNTHHCPSTALVIARTPRMKNIKRMDYDRQCEASRDTSLE